MEPKSLITIKKKIKLTDLLFQFPPDMFSELRLSYVFT